jgi:folate-binding protein YgfZ
VTQALRIGAVVASVSAGVFDLSGPGAVACIQGLLTNDIEKPGDGSLVFGAILSPKGMIVADGWAGRRGELVRFATSAEGRERAALVFQRSIPPRLAQVADRSAELRMLRLSGPAALAIAEAARLSIPKNPGRVELDGDVEVGRATEGAAFTLQWIGAPGALELVGKRLTAGGAVEGDPAALQLARIIAGWPSLASEVDDKTLPQEVRYDEIGGVSYTKGCYTGQETVSRVHFRGHPNRGLRGVQLSSEPPAEWRTAQPVHSGDKEVGRLTSVAWVPDGPAGSGIWMGLAILRREVPDGATVRIGMIEGRVTPLPLPLPRFEPA